jgi:DNA-directed RNA polymerase subunit RPC12/RpoP
LPEKDSQADPDTGLFGRLAVALNLITPEQLADSLDLQRRLAQGGRSLPLGKIMLAKGYVTAFQIEEILAAQSRKAVRCASCGAEFAVRHMPKPGSAPVRCPQCMRRLSEASVAAAMVEAKDTGAVEVDGKRAPGAPGPSAAAVRRAPDDGVPAHSAEAASAAKAGSTSGPPAAERRQPTATPPLMDVRDPVVVPTELVPVAGRAAVSLHIETTDGEVRDVGLSPGSRVVIGRAPGIDGIEIVDPSLSRKHCTVADEGGRLTIEDMRSRNGTFVNGERVTRAVLKSGDKIRVGDNSVVVKAPRGPRSTVGNTTDVMRAVGLCSLCGVVVSSGEIAAGKAQRTAAGILCTRCLEVALVPGRILGGYRIIEQIGCGGMAEVYRAEQVTSGRIAALKTLIDPQGAGEQARKRFVQEARAGARLEHPNLVRIYDAGEESGIPYIVMEFIEGQDLATLLDRRGFLPTTQALDIVLDIASVLAFAHSHGVVHRDVKPANIILDSVHGRARLLDLGVAKLTEIGHADGLTRAGMGLGTLEYASPEQIQSAKDADGRADIYSLAATLYRMVVGSRPFHANSELGLAKAVLYEPVGWPPEAAGRVPEALCKVVSKAMEKNRERRYASADEFREALLGARESLA